MLTGSIFEDFAIGNPIATATGATGRCDSRASACEVTANFKMSHLSEQCATSACIFLNFGGHLNPDLLAGEVAAARQLLGPQFDLRASVKTVTGLAKSRVHHNRIFMRWPHKNSPIAAP